MTKSEIEMLPPISSKPMGSTCHWHEHSTAMSTMVVLLELTDLVLFGLVIVKQEGVVTSAAKFRHLHCTPPRQFSRLPLYSAKRKKPCTFRLCSSHSKVDLFLPINCRNTLDNWEVYIISICSLGRWLPQHCSYTHVLCEMLQGLNFIWDLQALL